jgi:RHS repeat-associated protein
MGTCDSWRAAAAPSRTRTFDAFGPPIASTGTTPNPYLYSGERFDSPLNLYHLRARYYNMLTGRFETMDPGKESCCALRASQVGNIFDPRTLHKYVYAANNPVNVSDPTGRDLLEDFLVFHLDETGEGLDAYYEYKALVRAACIAVYISLWENLPMYQGVNPQELYYEAAAYCAALTPP